MRGMAMMWMQMRPRRVSPHWRLAVAVVLLALPPLASAQQTKRSAPAVFLRELHLDPLLLTFGLDSAYLRRAVEQRIRAAGRLAPDAGRVPSLDLSLTVPRAVGVEPEPRALLRVEVGRNLMERGSATWLLYEQSSSLPRYGNWRSLSQGAVSAVLDAVNAFLTGSTAGP